MKKGNRSFKVRKVKVAIFSLLLIFCLTLPSYSLEDKSVFRTESIEVPVTGNNNVAVASDRYIFVAPSEPSKPITDDLSLEQYDNNVLYLYDSKKLKNEPDKFLLGNCYFPSLVLFDPDTNTVFVKGTEFIKTDGEYKSNAVIKYLRFNLSEDSAKPLTDGFALTINIPGYADNQFADIAPDLIIDNKKDIIVFTNGAEIFSYSRSAGFLYRVSFIAAKAYDPLGNSITNLSFDSDSNVITVLINKKVKNEDDHWQHYSELYFYELAENGTFNLLKKLAPETLPVGVSVPGGSNIAIDTVGKQIVAYFVGTDGVLYHTSLTDDTGGLSGKVEPLVTFDELIQSSDGEHLSAVSTFYNKETRVFELLKNGYTSYIHRPVNVGRGRIGKIHRPVNLRFEVEGSAVVLAQFGKKNKLIQKAFSSEFDEQGGIFMFSDHSGNRFVASYQGNVFELNMAQGIDDATMNLLGQLGNRLSSVVAIPAREVLVAVNSSELSDEDLAITEFGSLVVAKRREENNFLSLVNWTKDSLTYNPVLGLGVSSIRRPCNYRLR